MNRKVVVTGIGALCPLGKGIDNIWPRILAGEVGITNITKFDAAEFSSQVAGEVKDFDVSEYMTPKEARKTELFIQYAIAASLMAVEDASLDVTAVDSDRFGTYIGSGIGGIGEVCRQQMVLTERGPRRVSPFFIPNAIANLASGHVSMRLKAKGPNSAVCTACATGTHAIGDAMNIIRRGDADIMIAGGTEAPIMPLAVAGFCSMRALSTRNDDPATASRPFDKNRDGFVIGEGAASLILEEKEHAINRGARIYCEVSGYGMSGDAHHLSAPAPGGEGAVRVIRAAIHDAGIQPDQIGYINAHGTSTPLNDKFETLAIKTVFGEQAKNIPVNSTKSMVGHLLGAAGAFEFGIVAKSLFENQVHLTASYQEPDPECDLDYIVEGSRKLQFEYALSNSFGFGGTNASLVAKKFIG